MQIAEGLRATVFQRTVYTYLRKLCELQLRLKSYSMPPRLMAYVQLAAVTLIKKGSVDVLSFTDLG